MYTKKQFLEDVAKEARALKKHATKEELDRLDFDNLDPDDGTECIYGQIGEFCRSHRAVELITKCCKRFFYNEVICELIHDKNEKPDDAVCTWVNGKVSKRPTSLTYVSSIETYIAMPEAKNKNLIDFLKGERKDLVL